MKTLIKLIAFTGLISVCFGFTLPRSVLVRLCQTGQSAQESGLSQGEAVQQVKGVLRNYLIKTYGNRYEYEYSPGYSIYMESVNNGGIQNVVSGEITISLVPSFNLGESIGSWQAFLANLANLNSGKVNVTSPSSGSLSEPSPPTPPSPPSPPPIPPIPPIPSIPDNIFDGLQASLANSSFPSFLPDEIFGKPTKPESNTEQSEPSSTESTESAETISELNTIPDTESPLTVDSDYCNQIDYPEQLDLNNPTEIRKTFLRVLISKLKLDSKKLKLFENFVQDYQDKLFN